MKKLWLIAALLFVSGLVFAETKMAVAVGDFSARNVSASDAITLSDFFRSELVNTKTVSVLDRNNMDLILNEQKFQSSGCTDQTCAVKMGKLLNVEKVIVGTVISYESSYYINVQVVDVEKGEIDLSEKVQSNNKEDLPQKAEELARLVSKKITGGIQTMDKTGNEETNMSGLSGLKQGLYAIFDTTQGQIVCELFEKQAPMTVKNFVELAEGTREWTDPKTGQKVKKKLYDGLIFHRVIPQFMIQGGDPLGRGTGGPGYRFPDEIVPELVFDKPGLLAMANAGPNTNGSQFFITTVPTPWLNGHHTIFGVVVSGFEAVKEIEKVPKGQNDRPVNDVIMKKVTIKRID